MNSLQDLNGYSDQTVEFQDQRAKAVVFSNATAVNGSVTVEEGSDHAVYLGTDVLKIINPEDDLYYEIYTYGVTGVYPSWEELPATVTVYENLTTGTWLVGPINSTRDWRTVRQPTLVYPRDWAPHIIYYRCQLLQGTPDEYTNATAYLGGGGGAALNSWVTTLEITDTIEITTPSTQNYTTGNVVVFSNYPEIVDADDDGDDQYTLTLQHYNNLVALPGVLSTSGSGNAGVWSGNVLTLTGTAANINTQLANLTYTPPVGLDGDYTLKYTLTNPPGGQLGGNLVTTVYQLLNNSSNTVLTKIGNETYSEDTNISLSSTPTFIDSHDGSGSYSMVIQAYPANSVSLITAVGSGGSPSYDSGSSALTITGDRTAVNSYMGNVTVVPTADYTNPIYLEFRAQTHLLKQGRRYKEILCTSTNEEVSGLDVQRIHARSTPAAFFRGSNPSIDEIVTGDPNYTVTISVPTGGFRTQPDTYVSSTTITGNRATVNNWFPTITYYPEPNYRGEFRFTYTQTRGNVTQIDALEIPMLVNNANAALPEQNTYNFYANAGSSWTFTPSEYQSRYLKCNLTVGGNVGIGGQVNPTPFNLPYDNYQILTPYTKVVTNAGSRQTVFMCKNELAMNRGKKFLPLVLRQFMSNATYGEWRNTFINQPMGFVASTVTQTGMQTQVEDPSFTPSTQTWYTWASTNTKNSTTYPYAPLLQPDPETTPSLMWYSMQANAHLSPLNAVSTINGVRIQFYDDLEE